MAEPTPAVTDEQSERLLRDGVPVDTERGQVLSAAGDQWYPLIAGDFEGSGIHSAATALEAEQPDRSVTAARR